MSNTCASRPCPSGPLVNVCHRQCRLHKTACGGCAAQDLASLPACLGRGLHFVHVYALTFCPQA